MLVGPSGAGKSTLLKLLSLQFPPTEGRILYHGMDPWRESAKEMAIRRSRVGMVFQEYALIPGDTALQNIAVSLLAQSLSKKEKLERCQAVLELVEMQDFAQVRIEQLSGGQRQRIALARALVHHPIVLFADEPFSSLDHEQTRRLLQRILQGEGPNTFVFATHHPHILQEEGFQEIRFEEA